MTENTVQELRPADIPPASPSEAPQANFKDYDQLISDRPPMQRRVGGKTIVFPKYLPAQILFNVRKAEIERKKKGVKETDEQVMWNWGFDLLRDILGPENFDHIMAYADLDIVMDITLDALSYYGLRNESEEDEGEGKVEKMEEAPASPSTPASSTSTPLMQTSSDSTPESGSPSGDATPQTDSQTGSSTSHESETSQKGASL